MRVAGSLRVRGVVTARPYREERRDVVVSLREAGLSIRAIASATGESRRTVDRALDAGGANAPRDAAPEPVIGTDGKTYKQKPRQRAAIAVEYLEVFKAEAKKRQGTRTDLRDIVEDLPQSETGQARDQVGNMFDISGKTVSEAKYVAENEPEAIVNSWVKFTHLINPFPKSAELPHFLAACRATATRSANGQADPMQHKRSRYPYA